VFAYTLRACVPARRRAVLVLPTLAAVAFGLLSQATGDPAPQAFSSVAGLALFGLIVPLACLVLGDAVLGAEVRAGTLAFTWLAPVPFPVIVVGRWLAGWAAAVGSLVPAAVAGAVAAGAPESAGPAVAGVVAGSAAYIAVFVMIGCTVRRAAVWSLALVFLVERLLGAALTGIAQLSPTWESQAVFNGYAEGTFDQVRDGIPQGGDAIVRLALITAVTLAVASWRLAHLRLSGAGD
jgi:ABC-type transport system involved in multi-copper enzyme maturation permease subunit